MALYAANLIKDGDLIKALDQFAQYGAPANPQVCVMMIFKESWDRL